MIIYRPKYIYLDRRVATSEETVPATPQGHRNDRRPLRVAGAPDSTTSMGGGEAAIKYLRMIGRQSRTSHRVTHALLGDCTAVSEPMPQTSHRRLVTGRSDYHPRLPESSGVAARSVSLKSGSSSVGNLRLNILHPHKGDSSYENNSLEVSWHENH